MFDHDLFAAPGHAAGAAVPALTAVAPAAELRIVWWTWATLAAMSLAIVGAAFTGWVPFDLGRCLKDLWATIACFFVLSRFIRWRMPNLDWLVPQFALVTSAGVIGTLFCYIPAGLGRPEFTASLVTFDEALGFDWRRHQLWLNGIPGAMAILKFAYQSFSYQLLLLPILMKLRRRSLHAHVLLLCFILGIFGTGVIGALFPVRDAAFWVGWAQVGPDGWTGKAMTDHWIGVREHRLPTVHLREMQGIVTFPSFHTTAAVLYTGFSGVLGRMAWPLILLNCLMIISALTYGSHHLVDLAGGALLGVSLLGLATYLLRRAQISHSAA